MRFERVAEGIYQMRTILAKVTAIEIDDGLVMVDAGARGSWRLVARGLTKLGLTPPHVKLAVLTHYHPDHTGGLRGLVSATSAQVMAHYDDGRIVSGEAPYPSPFVNPAASVLMRPVVRLLGNGRVSVDRYLSDGDLLPASREIRVVHTPGHTAGSISLLVADAKVLIVGDALQFRRRRLELPAPAVSQDMQQARESLKRLLPLDFETICFSHFEPLRNDGRQAVQALIDDVT